MNDPVRPTPAPPRARGYFITFTTYGTRLHGDAEGSVDIDHRLYGTEFCAPNASRQDFERRRMIQTAYLLDAERRRIVLRSSREVCEFRRWWLFAAHVRSNHVHLIIQANEEPERVMNDLKSYASRALTNAGFENSARRRWSHHGSTRYLWNHHHLRNAINYVLHEQGNPMETYLAPVTPDPPASGSIPNRANT